MVPAGSDKLWLAIQLPQFPLEIATRGTAERKACVLVEGQGTRQRVLLANPQAARLGIRPGMSMAAAHALGEIATLPRDACAEQRALDQLCAWAYQFTPLLSPVAPDGLVLEVRGSLELFGGTAGLLREIRRGLRELGFRGYFAAAPTPLAATLLARGQRQRVVDACAELPGAVSELPIDVLRLPARQLQDFYCIGVRTLGDCLRLPRESLGRRFQPALLEDLDRMLGQRPDPRPYFAPSKVFASRLDLLWEIHTVQALGAAMGRLLHELAGCLRAHVAVARQLRWVLHHADATCTHHSIALAAPSREQAHLALLTRERCNRLQLHSPVRGIELQVEDILQDTAPVAGDLFREKLQPRLESWPQFVDRLRARLGEHALKRIMPVADHRPERACRWADPWAPPGAAERSLQRAQGTAVRRPATRPLWLTREPLPLRERNGQPDLGGALRLSAERERIESGWWDGEDVARDYFVATDPRGARLWVFKELTGEQRWYLHGIFE